jgi:hypothetical protein
MIIEEGTDYSETSVTKYQQRRATSRKSEGFNISDIYNLYSLITLYNEKKYKLRLITSSGTMSERNVYIRYIPLNSRKITDTYNSQILRNFCVLI